MGTAPLPVAALDLPEDCERRLALVGLHTLGAIAALPNIITPGAAMLRSAATVSEKFKLPTSGRPPGFGATTQW